MTSYDIITSWIIAGVGSWVFFVVYMWGISNVQARGGNAFFRFFPIGGYVVASSSIVHFDTSHQIMVVLSTIEKGIRFLS